MKNDSGVQSESIKTKNRNFCTTVVEKWKSLIKAQQNHQHFDAKILCPIFQVLINCTQNFSIQISHGTMASLLS